MAPRKRSFVKRDLPTNLYENKGYYSWQDPRTGKRYPLGRDKKAAIRQANEANFAINDELSRARLVDRLTGEGERTFENFVPVYEALLDKRKMAESTRKWRKQRLQKVKEALGKHLLARITTLQIANFIDNIEAQGKGRMAQVYRSELMDFFRMAQTKGWTDANPVTVTRAAEVEVKRERLTLEVFKAIYAKALDMEPWVANSMALALVTAQRREDISELQFKRDAHDDFLWVNQGKGGTKLKIPLKLRLTAVGWSIEEIIGRCRDDVVSRYLIHSAKKHAKAKPGDKLHPSSLSAGFAKARELAVIENSLQWHGTPPTFHELRSLSKRLYTAQGIDTKILLGHKTQQMADLYNDVRGFEWLEVKL